MRLTQNVGQVRELSISVDGYMEGIYCIKLRMGLIWKLQTGSGVEQIDNLIVIDKISSFTVIVFDVVETL